MKLIYLLFIIITVLSLVGCGSITRVETDSFSDVKRDTTVMIQNINHPGNRDNGVVYPSSKIVQIEHNVNMQNYEVERHYPNFIRFGLFEGVGLIGTSSTNKIGAGLFGVFPDFGKLGDDFRGTDSKFFSGGIYRVGIFEWRLRWFKDSPDWTYGFSGVEFILPNAKGEEMLIGIAPLYIRKRYFIKSDIPYITFTPSVGISLFPSQYLNFSGSLDIGSIGGLNLRSYLGLALGYNSASSPQIVNNDFTKDAQYPIIPYFGIGVSVLDFLNKVEETEIEWKDHEHSSWVVGLFQYNILMSSTKNSAFTGKDDKKSSTFKGYQAKIANASVVLPFIGENYFAGTSLANLTITGYEQIALAILPLRFGYWHIILEDDLSAEPFIELSYYPSVYINLNNKINFRLSDMMNLNINFGYINCLDNENLVGFDDSYGIPSNFSNFYIGVGLSFFDRIFYPKELRYNK